MPDANHLACLRTGRTEAVCEMEAAARQHQAEHRQFTSGEIAAAAASVSFLIVLTAAVLLARKHKAK